MCAEDKLIWSLLINSTSLEEFNGVRRYSRSKFLYSLPPMLGNGLWSARRKCSIIRAQHFLSLSLLAAAESNVRALGPMCVYEHAYLQINMLMRSNCWVIWICVNLHAEIQWGLLTHKLLKITSLNNSRRWRRISANNILYLEISTSAFLVVRWEFHRISARIRSNSLNNYICNPQVTRWSQAQIISRAIL